MRAYHLQMSILMNKELQYNGFSAVPSDYECPDGSLAVSINLLPENGALQPVLPPTLKRELLLLMSQKTVLLFTEAVSLCHSRHP